MSRLFFFARREALLLAIATVSCTAAHAQTALPSVTIKAAGADKAKPARASEAKPGPQRVSRSAMPAGRARPSSAARGPAGGGGAGGAAASADVAAVAAARSGEAQASAQRARILPQTGANATTLTRQNVQNLPQGDNTPFNRVMLQLPGVTQDSSASGDFHVRNEHGNVQYRINGVFLPEDVSGFSQVLTSSFIRSVTLLDGALPAQYGLRTAGIIDIQTRTGAERPGGDISVYGGSQETIMPTLDYAGVSGRWDYFVTGRFETNNLGIQNPLPTVDPTHDRTRQGRYFAYVSGQLEDNSRLTFMSGAGATRYQIPNTPGLPPQFTAFGIDTFNSATLDQNQVEYSIFNVLAWQKSYGALDSQISYFQRFGTVNFRPDPLGDIIFNGVASNVTREALANGIQSDNSWRTSARNTLRFGFITQVENARVADSNVLLPTVGGNPVDAPFTIANTQRPTGVVAGVYLQDAYELTPQITINGGLRYDYMHQYVDADQLSPRLGAEYRPFATTVFHAGYARYFTPPSLVTSAPNPTALFANTTLEPEVQGSSPVRPERSHYFDVGVTQTVLPGLDLGVDAYYKLARNLLDDGQFGQAYVLTAFNYDRAFNRGIEFKGNYQSGGFRLYGNLALAQQKATQVSSNQYLFEADELAYIRNNYIFTDHAQLITVSGGGSYTFGHTTLSTEILYGSGLRNGFANTGTVSPYATVNVGATHEFRLLPNAAATTLRVAVVNLTDNVYQLRDGSGIGVFAPQYGQRRGFYAGLSQRF